MTSPRWAVLSIGLCCACTDPVLPADGGGGAGGAVSSATTAATTQSSSITAGTGGQGGGDACGVPTTATIDAAGGEIEHCGATLVVPPDAVSRPTTLSIVVIDPPAAAPFNHELISPVYEVSPEMPELLAPVSLRIEHTPVEGYVKLARFESAIGGFGAIEACDVTETSIQQFVGQLGTWAVLHDTNDYPDSTTGLGDGTIDLQFLGQDVVYDLDDPLSHGIYQDSADGTRVVTLTGRREVAGGLEQFHVDFVVPEVGEPALVQLDWISTVTGTGYSYIDGLIGSGGMIAVDRTPEGRFVGTLSANAVGGDQQHEEALSAGFDVAVELYAYPPELVCPGGKER